MGSNLGNWEFVSQTNNTPDCVANRKQIQNCGPLSTIEDIKVLTICLSSFHMKDQFPSDIPPTKQVDSNKHKYQAT